LQLAKSALLQLRAGGSARRRPAGGSWCTGRPTSQPSGLHSTCPSPVHRHTECVGNVDACKAKSRRRRGAQGRDRLQPVGGRARPTIGIVAMPSCMVKLGLHAGSPHSAPRTLSRQAGDMTGRGGMLGNESTRGRQTHWRDWPASLQVSDQNTWQGPAVPPAATRCGRVRRGAVLLSTLHGLDLDPTGTTCANQTAQAVNSLASNACLICTGICFTSFGCTQTQNMKSPTDIHRTRQ
jgi:hypothetical protein